MMTSEVIALLAALLLSGLPARAAPLVILNSPGSEAQAKGSATPHFEVLEDLSDSLEISEIASPEFESRFKPLEQAGKFSEKTTYWLRLQLLSQTATSTVYAIEIPEDEVDSYQLYSGMPRLTTHTGLLVPHDQRNPDHLLPLIIVELPPGEKTTVYLRARHHWGHRIQPDDPTYGTIYHFPTLQKLDAREAHLLGFYYGLVSLISLVSFVVYLTFRNPIHGIYSLFSILFGLYSYALSGYAFQYLWPGFSQFNKISAILLAPCVLFSFTLFTSGFLRLRQITPRLERALLALALAFFMTIPLFLTNHRTEAYVFQTAVASISFILILCGGGIAVLKGQRSAWMFIAGNTSLIVVSVFQFLTMLSVLPYTVFFRFGMQLGSALQLVSVLAGLFFDLWLIRQERERAAERQLRLQRRALESKQRLLEAFARFVPKDFLTCLGKTDITQVQLGDASERKMAVLFSDIRSFSTLSENLSPKDTFAFLNAYLSEVGPSITEHGGFIDKFIGDGIMALFPNGGDGALRAAHAMIERTRQFSFRTTDSRLLSVSIGVGIHYGTVVLGTIGETRRMEGTVISDTVNVASRIEQLTKTFRIPLIASEDFLLQLSAPELAPSRRLGKTRIRGRAGKLNVHEIFVADPEPIRTAKWESKQEFEKAIALFQSKDFREAEIIIQRLSAKYPGDEVIRYFLAKNDWTGWIRSAKKAA